MSSLESTKSFNPLEASDCELVRLALEDDGQGFAFLVERYFPMVVALGISRLGDRELSEELAQEVFMRAFLNLEKLRDGRLFAAWLTRITRNVAEDWARSEKTSSHAVAVICMEELPGELEDHRSANPCESAIARQHSDILGKALFRLPQDLREIVLLHYIEDLEKVEIARRLGVHASSVGRRLDRALQLLRCNLEETAAFARNCKPSRQSYDRTRTIGVALAGLSLAGRAKAAGALAPSVSAATISVAVSPAASTPSLFNSVAMLIQKFKSLLSRAGDTKVSPKGALVGGAATVAVIIACLYNHSVAQQSRYTELAEHEILMGVECGTLGMLVEPTAGSGQLAQSKETSQQQP